MQTLQAALQSSHEDLQQWFLLHQECLLLGNDPLAMQALHAFADYLNQHIHFENHTLFTAIADSAGTLRWPLPVYHKEHDKLQKMLQGLQQRTGQYQGFTGRYKRLALLELLDEQQRFRHVMEHHEQREEQDLFLLINQLPEHLFLLEQWQQIDRQLLQQFAPLRQSLKAILAD